MIDNAVGAQQAHASIAVDSFHNTEVWIEVRPIPRCACCAPTMASNADEQSTRASQDDEFVMTYDPNRHHRQSIRLRGYDYTQPGAYFVTICTYQRQRLFDDPLRWRIAEQQWRRIANERVTLDSWVVMPDHVHGIIVITEATPPASIGATPSDNAVGAQQAHPSIGATPIHNVQSRMNPDRSTDAPAAPLRDDDDNYDHRGLGINVTPGSLGAIVRSYKASVTRMINSHQARPGGLVWQRGYWERIVRDDLELDAIRRYIAENPVRWAEGPEDLDRLLARMNVKE